jgi:endonuclease YncB( thermonuclease family)
MTWRSFILGSLTAVLIAAPATAQSRVIGVASVVDGDTLEIHGQRIRLHGVDAPESKQTCEKDEKLYRCGQQAAFALSDKIGRATIHCDQQDIDRYKRIVAICRLGDEYLNAWMVRQGWALAYRQYSLDYVDEESAARAAKAGIWVGRFIEPWKWRRGARLTADKAQGLAANSCQIKGNINRSGDRIYHVPGGRYYDRTKINEANGERWFCSEDEAVKAGWLRSRQ